MEKEMEKIEQLNMVQEEAEKVKEEWNRLKQENLQIGKMQSEINTLNELNKEKIDELVKLKQQNEELRCSNDYLKIELIKYQVLFKKIEESGISTIQHDDDIDNQFSELDNHNNDNNEYKLTQGEFRGKLILYKNMQ